MKCEVCRKKTGINWGSGEVVLCEQHADSDMRELENERIQKRMNEYTPVEDLLSPDELKEKMWGFYHFGPRVTLGLIVAGLSPGIIITAIWQSNYLLLTLLLPAVSILSKELRVMLVQHERFMFVTKRALVMVGFSNLGFLDWGVFVVALVSLFIISFYWFFQAQHYFYLTDFRKVNL